MTAMKALEKLRRIDSLLAAGCRGLRSEAQQPRRSGDGAAEVMAALSDADWQIVQAALHSICLHPRKEYAPSILAVLHRQDELDIYGQKEDMGVAAGFPWPPAAAALQAFKDKFPASKLDAWKCRWRVKQAACHALGAIGEQFGPQAVGREAVRTLCGYVMGGKSDDYQVLAAACLALGQIKDPSAKPALEAGAGNDEFCTRTEALRALEQLSPAAVPETKDASAVR